MAGPTFTPLNWNGDLDMENKTTERGGAWKSALLTLILLFFMWPMLKGTYYKHFGEETPVSGIQWETNFQTALAESEKTGKPILLDFSATWCPPCQVMKHEVWTNDEVGNLASDRYLPVLIDIVRPENRPLAQQYQVSSIPDIVVVNSHGQILKRGGFLSASQMVDFLKQ